MTASRVEAIKTTELARWPLNATTTRPQKIEVRCEGDDCAFFHQERLIGRIKDSMFAEGRVGLYLGGKGNAVFNDLLVEEFK